MTKSIKLFLFAFFACASPLVAHAQFKSTATQYGHQTGWKVDLPDTIVSAETGFERSWTVNVGEGRSQIVVDGDRLLVLAGESEKRKGKSPLVKTRLLCLDRATGNEVWKHESDPKPRLEGQESFSGATLSPRATPTILGDNIVAVSYTGILECVNLESGELRWSKNLVELGATPVQFGFASSPVGDQKTNDRFYVTAAGPEGALYCFATADGSTIWKSPCPSFSYATPTFATFNGVEQILIVTCDEILGFEKLDGKQLWRHELREKGLTNVPSPIVFSDGFIHSSQGAKGTSRVDVTKIDGQWQTKERWYTRRAQYFYSNWTLVNDELILGVADGLLVALNVGDGTIAGKWRGFADGNLVRVADLTYLVDGKGTLNTLSSKLDADEPRFEVHQKIDVLKARCWTPPTVLPEGLLLRGGEKLTLVKFTNTDQSRLEKRLEKPKPLKLNKRAAAEEDIDYVSKIFTTYQESGADKAIALYGKLRTQEPSPLSVEDRILIIKAAKEQGLNDLAKMILEHAKMDFPDSDEIRNLD